MNFTSWNNPSIFTLLGRLLKVTIGISMPPCLSVPLVVIVCTSSNFSDPVALKWLAIISSTVWAFELTDGRMQK